MLALLDVGNTSITYGIYAGGRFLASGNVKNDDIPKIDKILSKSGSKVIDEIVLSSVVPQITRKIEKRFRSKKGVTLYIAGKDLKVPIRHKYKNINKLGVDRSVNIYGALKIYKTPLVVIDFGTAITMDYVSPKGIFEGGLIIPGPEISFQALIKRAALIPKSLHLPSESESFLGRDTLNCIKSGVLEGYGALTSGLLAKFREKYGKNVRFIATGGFARHLKPFIRGSITIDPLHSLKSLLLLYKSTLS